MPKPVVSEYQLINIIFILLESAWIQPAICKARSTYLRCISQYLADR